MRNPDVFPHLKKLHLSGEVLAPYPYQSYRVSMNKDNMLTTLPCPNPYCKHGGFNLKPIVNQISEQRKTHADGVIMCPGAEWVGRGQYGDTRSCGHRLRWEIAVEYDERSNSNL